MATCGPRTPCPPSSRNNNRRCAFAARWLLTVAGGLLAIASLVGCAAMEFGARPRVERLGGLTRGVTTRADVLLALGEPRGSGGAVIEPGASPEEIWLYEFVKTDGKEIALQILLVFFDGERYDGHLWFRSVEEVRRGVSQGRAAGTGPGRDDP